MPLKTEAPSTDRRRERAARMPDDLADQFPRLAHAACQMAILCYAQEECRKGRGTMAEHIEAPNIRGAASGSARTRNPVTCPETPHD